LVTFNPTPTEGHLDMALPLEKGGPSNAPPPPNPLEDETEELTMTVDAKPNGEIESVRLSNKDGLDKPIGSDVASVFMEMQRRAKEKTAESKPTKIKLELGETLSYKLVISLMDHINRAGFKQVAPALIDTKK
jgi:biopolymer transport protein ExbD